MSLAAVGASVGLGRLAARRVRADLPFLFAVWLVLSAATTLVAGAFQYSDAVATGGLRRAILDAGPADRGVSVQTTGSSDQEAGFDAAVSGTMARLLGPVAPVVLAARSTSLAPFGMPSDQAALHLTYLGADAGIEDHASLTSGSWPIAGQDPVQASLSTGAARALGLAVGDRLALVDASVPGNAGSPLLTVVVTGTWTADADDPYWLGDALDLDGIVDQGSLAYRGPFMVAPDDLLSRGLVKHLVLTWRAGVAVNRIVPADLSPLQQALTALAPTLAAALPARQPISVSTGLAPVLAGVQQSLGLAQGGVALLIIQFVVLAAFAVILVAALLSERRRRENRILESRGATRRQILAVTAAEALLVTIPAAVIAPPVAALAVHLLATGGPLARAGVDLPLAISGPAVLAALLAGLAAVAALIAPAVPAGGRIRTIRLALGREGTRVSAQRFGIDLALLLVAALALWQLRLYGSPVIRSGSGELGIDPLLVAGPAVGLAACSLLATRALPRLARLAERVLVDRPNVVPQLGAHDLARRPLRSIRSSLLVMLAAGLTTFAIVYDATWVRSQEDQAAYQAAADIRVVTPAYSKVPAAFLGSTYRAMDGVTAAIPVTRTTIDVGGSLRSADVMGVDALRTPEGVSLPGGPAGPLAGALRGLAADRPTAAAMTLPGTPRRLAVTMDANLQTLTTAAIGGPAGVPVDSPTGITVAVVIIDGDGETWVFGSTGGAPFLGRGEQIVIPLDASGLIAGSGGGSTGVAGGDLSLAAPIRLEALEISALPSLNVTITTGTLDLRALEASDAASGDTWSTVPFDPLQPGWAWQRVDPANTIGGPSQATPGPIPYLPPAGRPSRIAVGTETSDAIYGSFDNSPTLFRTSAAGPSEMTVGAIASSSYLAATGQHVGDTFSGSVAGNPVEVRIAAEAALVPPLDPVRPFLVMDGPTLSLAQYFEDGVTVPVTEWWLTVQPGRSSSVARQLAAPPVSATTTFSREAIQVALMSDPVALGVVGALLLGAISAVIFAALGFLVSASASIESRADEFGLLRALGLTDGQLTRWLAAEQALLLATGVAVGIGLGVAFGWIVLPAANFTPTGARPVPDAELVVPWQAVAAMVIGSVGLLSATLIVARRVLGRISVAAILRAVVE